MNESNYSSSKLALFMHIMSTVTGCILFLPAAYASNQENHVSISFSQNLSSHIKEQLIFQEKSTFLNSPILVSGPYNFDPSLAGTLTQTQVNNLEAESLSILGQPTILKDAPQELTVNTIEKQKVKLADPQVQSHKNIADSHIQKKKEQDIIKKEIISQRLYKVAEKEFDQEERQKFKQLKQVEKLFETLEKQEVKRLKKIERDQQKSIQIAKKEKNRLAKLEKQNQKKAENEKRRQDKLARKRKKEQDDLAKKKEKEIEKSNTKKESDRILIKPIGFESDFARDTNKSGQLNQIAEGTAIFKMFNGDQLTITSGQNIYDQMSTDRIYNIPLKLGWEHEINDFTLSAKAGIDLYDRLKVVPNFSISATKPIDLPKSWAKVFSLSAEIDHAQYKFNAETIENDIRYLRLKGSLFWQIKENTSFFTSAHMGTLNDGNFEHQVFSRLEKKFAKTFSVAGNLFIWGFSEDLSNTSGYFSPPDFLVYNGELAWTDDITDFLNCRVAISLGQQRAQGEWSNASSLKTTCKTKVSKNLEVSLGYEFSNSFSNTNISDSAFFANRFTAKVKAKF